MHLLVAFALVGSAVASIQPYGNPIAPYPPQLGGLLGGFGGDFRGEFGGRFGGGIGGRFGGGFGGGYRNGFRRGYGGGYNGGIRGDVGYSCGNGLVVNVYGNCVEPLVTHNIFAFNPPELPYIQGPPPPIPPPKVDYNIVFVRTPEEPQGAGPVVVPPPQQKTLVYVLSKNGLNDGQEVIEVPAGPKERPEVIYVNYDDGDNPILPGGFSLHEALASANTQQGQVIGGLNSGLIGGEFGGRYGQVGIGNGLPYK